jgi:hypothetical protein
MFAIEMNEVREFKWIWLGKFCRAYGIFHPSMSFLLTLGLEFSTS